MMSAMQQIIGQWLYSIKHYSLMCLLLSGPARLPASPYPILLTGFVYFMLGLSLVGEQRSYFTVCLQISIELLMLALISYAMLRWKRLRSRLQQTFAALLGITVVFTLVTIPIYRAVSDGGVVENSLLSYIIYAIQIWNLAVLSLIFKRSFEISTQLSAIIAFGYFVTYHITFYWLFL